jgi:hypothetical protein
MVEQVLIYYSFINNDDNHEEQKKCTVGILLFFVAQSYCMCSVCHDVSCGRTLHVSVNYVCWFRASAQVFFDRSKLKIQHCDHVME